MSTENQAETATEAVRSPLHDEHVALGAALVPFAGWLMPLRYTSDLAEHTAVRTAAGLFDLSHMAELWVSGPDAGAFLDRALVGALGALGVGRARYTMICAEDGGVLDDLVVYRPREDAWLVVANAANRDTVVAALTQRLTARRDALDVTFEDRTDATALVAVQGPRALEIVTAAGVVPVEGGAGALADLRYYAALDATVVLEEGGEPIPVLVARTGYTGEDGFELFVDAAAGPALWRALLAAGEPLGLVPAGLAARDSLRLEAGMPLYGHELTTETTPFAAGLGRVVRLDKVDAAGEPVAFVGREALAAAAEAAPQRVLVGLAGESRRAGREGYPVLDAAGDPVGVVTSGAPSPTLGHPVAMAYVRPDVAEPGTALAVDVRGRAEPVRVVALPFYRRADRA
jgi:aminomethyltransferase